MFKMIGAVVVYGLALFGLIEGLEQLDARINNAKRPAGKPSRPDAEGPRDGGKHVATGSPGAPQA